MSADFTTLVATKVAEIDRRFAPFESPLQGRDELQRQLNRLSKAVHEGDNLDTHRQLVTLAAQVQRMARDCNLDTEAAAVQQDDDCLNHRNR
jgi:hypothetical protein